MKKINFFLQFFFSRIILLTLISKIIFYFFFDHLVYDWVVNYVNNLEIPVIEFSEIEKFDVIFHTNKSGFDLVIAILIASFLIVLLLAQANLLNLSFFPNSTFDSEKYSPYECGFAPFKTERSQFDIKFYLVALLFLVFDVELMFLLPYCLSYYYLGITGYLIFLSFFSLLLIGFLVEWASGMLIWKGEKVVDLYEHETYQLKNNEQMYDFPNQSTYVFLYVSHLDNRRLFIHIHRALRKSWYKYYNKIWLWNPTTYQGYENTNEELYFWDY